MTAMESLAAHYSAVRKRLDSKPQKVVEVAPQVVAVPQKLEWSTPSVVEIKQPRNSLRELARYVATMHGVDTQELIEAKVRRNPKIVQARCELYYLAYHTTVATTSQIARAFKRDHSTVIRVARGYAARKNLPLSNRREDRHAIQTREGYPLHRRRWPSPPRRINRRERYLIEKGQPILAQALEAIHGNHKSSPRKPCPRPNKYRLMDKRRQILAQALDTLQGSPVDYTSSPRAATVA